MWRDRWFAVGVIAAALSCLACLTPVTALAFVAVGQGAWAGHEALLPSLVLFVAVAAYRSRVACRRAP